MLCSRVRVMLRYLEDMRGLFLCIAARLVLPLIVAEIEIDFSAVVKDKTLAMFGWRHGASIDIQIRIDFNTCHLSQPSVGKRTKQVGKV